MEEFIDANSDANIFDLLKPGDFVQLLAMIETVSSMKKAAAASKKPSKHRKAITGTIYLNY